MSKSRLTATPTEYRGVVYRSKCEAMFARYLQLESELEDWSSIFLKNVTGMYSTGFCYEPEFLTVNGYCPDFLVWTTSPGKTNDDKSLIGFPSFSYSVIEYKPSLPSQTYVKTFFSRCFDIAQLIASEQSVDAMYRTDYAIYYGSVYNKQRGVFRSVGIESRKISWFEEKSDWIADLEDEIASTRFDLARPVGS